MKFVNDSIDRDDSEVHQYNRSLKKKNEQKQYLLCLVEWHTQSYPSCVNSQLSQQFHMGYL